MIDGFMDEYGILVIMAVFAIMGLWPVWLAFFLAILIRLMLKGEKNEGN